MTNAWIKRQVDEPGLVRLAELVALKIRPGDLIALQGDLGAGKTTFARALIRAVLGDPGADVPSPTFSLVQTYDAARLALAHLDFYRLVHQDEARELGLEDLRTRAAAIIEWPERAPDLITGDRLVIAISESPDAEARDVALAAHGTWQERLQRLAAIDSFLNAHSGLSQGPLSYLQGDASPRGYARLSGAGQPVILMDWPAQPDGPPVRNGLPYSRIAHLAEGTPAFTSIAGLLEHGGLVVPHILAADHVRGLLLIEDLGDAVFASEVARGQPLEAMWTAATDALLRLRAIDEPTIAQWQTAHPETPPIRSYDRGVLAIEVELLPDWYWPMLHGTACPAEVRDAFLSAWEPVFDRILADTGRCLTLRDYHSPNLLWLPDRDGPPALRVGIIDFQDALIGPAAFDLVSLLQDARLDVDDALEHQLFARYLSAAAASEADFDAARFAFSYAALGAQRLTKILGIFARLWKRDGKPQYLRHIPRLWRYLERDLAHPDLGPLRTWFDTHLPPEARARVPAV